MESWSQNPEFRINPENFHPCSLKFIPRPEWQFSCRKVRCNLKFHLFLRMRGYLSRDMTYVRQAKAQTSLLVHAV